MFIGVHPWFKGLFDSVCAGLGHHKYILLMRISNRDNSGIMKMPGNAAGCEQAFCTSSYMLERDVSVDETDSTRKFCHSCGAVYSDGQRMCMSCGASLTLSVPRKNGGTRKGKHTSSIADFNFGAFLIPVFWTTGYRLWKYTAILICLLLANVIVPIFMAPLGPVALLPLMIILVIRLGFAIYLGIHGSQLAWNKAKQTDVDKFLKMQRAWGVAGVITFGFFTLYSVYGNMPNFKRARAKSDITACEQQLRNISSGLEYHITETGSLSGIQNEDDICHHVIAGYDDSKGCAGLIRKRADEFCQNGSLDVKVIDEARYEIRAKARGSSQCNICVTESEVRPATYDPECKKFTCIHKDE